MEPLSHHDITIFFLALGVLLGVARLLGELASKFHQPAVMGEILAGILLGPTIFGKLMPEMQAALFPSEGAVPVILEGISVLAIALFLLVAGLEVDLSTVWRQGRTAVTVGATGMVIPFALGFVPAFFAPMAMGAEQGADTLIFSLFLATALSISALPVIAKILMDLNMFKSDIGMIVVAAAIFNDIAGWLVFAVVLGMMGTAKAMSLPVVIGLTLLFAGLMLTVGKWLIHRSLPWVQARLSYPAGVLGLGLAVALLCSAFTEWIGIHAIFGAFLFGVALGDSKHLKAQTRTTLEQFISFIFAPIFFAGIGLRVDFVANFDLVLIVIVLVIATLGKVLGCGLGARLSALPWRESWAVGWGMNARGAMEIILGLLALEAGVIGERMFVALVIMALVTSMSSGTMIQFILKKKKPVRFFDFLSNKTFQPNLEAASREEAINELSHLFARDTQFSPDEIAGAVWRRETLMPTGLGNGLAAPHARMKNLKNPKLAMGISPRGIDFDAPDGKPARLIFLILTPEADYSSQLEILADIGRTFKDPARLEKAMACRSHTELLAMIKSELSSDSH